MVVQELVDEPVVAPRSSGEPLERDALRAWLHAEGLVREPIAEELSLADEWDLLPAEEKDAVRWALDHLPSGPMVSDIIIENRR